MPETSRVPQEVLDGIRGEMEALSGSQMMEPEPEEQEPDAPEEPEEPEEQEEGDEPDAPEGYKTLEEYVADGGDPDYYKGPKAYEQQKEILKELKDIKAKARERDEEMAALTDHFEKERKRLLKQVEEEQAKAKEDLDFDRYEELSKQRQELESGKAEQQEQGEHPVIAGYRNDNPEINPADPSFDPVYSSAFAAAFNAMVEQAAQRAGRPLNEAEIGKYLEATKQKLRPQQPAQKRTPKVEGTRKKTAKVDPVAALDQKTKQLYERWSKSPKKHLQEAAKKLLTTGGQ